ncbi:MAG: flagellar biosynthesis regulator FlaF [Gemmatimonadetes bacterium]|nr:flagellar biosynthesis regulator FlaF [Gemmatimonadota bacterium]
MPSHVADAYATVEKITVSGRQLEASALFRVARALQQAQAQWATPGGPARLDEALKLNQKLWTFFQAEISAPDCPLPAELKLGLCQLIEFVDRRTFDVLLAPAPDKLTILININRNIAAGLSTSPKAAPVGAGA